MKYVFAYGFASGIISFTIVLIYSVYLHSYEINKRIMCDRFLQIGSLVKYKSGDRLSPIEIYCGSDVLCFPEGTSRYRRRYRYKVNELSNNDLAVMVNLESVKVFHCASRKLSANNIAVLIGCFPNCEDLLICSKNLDDDTMDAIAELKLLKTLYLPEMYVSRRMQERITRIKPDVIIKDISWCDSHLAE